MQLPINRSLRITKRIADLSRFKLVRKGTQGAKREATAALNNLSKELAEELKRELHTISNSTDNSARLETLYGPLTHLVRVREALKPLLAANVSQNIRVDSLRQLSNKIAEAFRRESRDNHSARQAFIKTLGALVEAEARIDPPSVQEITEEVEDCNVPRRVIVPTELLLQAHRNLFPAERMLVITGRRCDDTAMLGACFDVTGDAHTGHVRADPNRLGAALIAMDKSDTFLAAWVHSHPGRGPGCTCPSPTDLDQHRDWITDYPLLLSAIIVEDGWIRFWGKAIETGQVKIDLIGAGVINTEIKESSKNGFLYRIES